MPKEFSRSRRVGVLIQRELSDIISHELDLSSLGMLTVSAVDLSSDLQHAKVYVTLLGDASHIKEVMQKLLNQGGHLRHILSQRLNMRSTPRLHFMYDESVAYGNELSHLIDIANKDPEDKA